MQGISSTTATNDFLNLLTVQLTHQDPIEPVKQEDFTAQLAQFSMLEQLESMSDSFAQSLELGQLSQGIGMVGKQADYVDALTGAEKSGVVDELVINDGPIGLMINGERVGLNLISGVKFASESPS